MQQKVNAIYYKYNYKLQKQVCSRFFFLLYSRLQALNPLLTIHKRKSEPFHRFAYSAVPQAAYSPVSQGAITDYVTYNQQRTTYNVF